jgi:hypothetical protein
MLKHPYALALFRIITCGIAMPFSLMSAGSVLAGTIIGNG